MLYEECEKRTGIPPSPEAATAFRQIDLLHPDFIGNVAKIEKLVDFGDRDANCMAIAKYRRCLNGCIWFPDPATGKALLADDDWITPCMTESVWSTLIEAFPVLLPLLMTGRVTGTLALRMESEKAMDEAALFFKDNGESIGRHCVIRKSGEFWTVFSSVPARGKLCRECGPLGAVDGVEICATAGLIPIPFTTEWGEKPARVEIVEYGGEKGAMRRLPDFLVPYFFGEPES